MGFLWASGCSSPPARSLEDPARAEALLRIGTRLAIDAMTRARACAVRDQEVYFVVFSNLRGRGHLDLCRDAKGDRIFDGGDVDAKLESVDLPEGCLFERSPSWMGCGPSGDLFFDDRFSKMSHEEIERALARNPPIAAGDLILGVGQGFRKVSIELNVKTGKVERQELLRR